MSAPELQPTWKAAQPVLPPHIIHEIEKQRREREDRYPAQIPLEHDDRPPPSGWGDQEEDAPSRRHDDDDGWHFKF